jgi:hypothetical protein
MTIAATTGVVGTLYLPSGPVGTSDVTGLFLDDDVLTVRLMLTARQPIPAGTYDFVFALGNWTTRRSVDVGEAREGDTITFTQPVKLGKESDA